MILYFLSSQRETVDIGLPFLQKFHSLSLLFSRVSAKPFQILPFKDSRVSPTLFNTSPSIVSSISYAASSTTSFYLFFKVPPNFLSFISTYKYISLLIIISSICTYIQAILFTLHCTISFC